MKAILGVLCAAAWCLITNASRGSDSTEEQLVLEFRAIAVPARVAMALVPRLRATADNGAFDDLDRMLQRNEAALEGISAGVVSPGAHFISSGYEELRYPTEYGAPEVATVFG